jgi:signal transduction histidine kinase
MTGAMLLLLLLFCVGNYIAVRDALNSDFDRSLMHAAESLMALTELEGGDVEVEFGPDALMQATYFQLWFADGDMLIRSDSLCGVDLPRFSVPGGMGHQQVTLPAGLPGRALGIRFTPRSDDWDHVADPPVQLTLVVAKQTLDLSNRLRGYAQFLAIAGLVIMAVTIVVARVIVRRGLAPVDAMAGQIAAIREDDLSTRVMAANIPGELIPMVDKLNAMLDRLALAFERERSFTGNVAHELRTPLTGVRSTMEVALRNHRSDEQYRAAMNECLTIVERMQGMIETLILLSRLDAGQLDVRRESVVLADLIDACRQAVLDRPTVTFENRVPADLRCAADPDKLMMVLCNLLQNAGEYVNEGGRIQCDAQRVADGVRLDITNTGCALSPDEARRVTERFWRADAARSDTGVHAGLGLALVERLMAAQDGAIAFDSNNGIFAARITLPHHA